MRPRYRLAITADSSTGSVALAADPPPAEPAPAAADAPAPAPPPPSDRFHTLIIVEGVMTGDKRLFAENSLDWRDLPLPLMAHDENTPEHLGAVLIGNVDTIERQGLELHGWGSYITEPDEVAADLIRRVQLGELRGVSADIDNVEFEVLVPQTDANGDPLPDPMLGLFDLFGDEEELADAPPLENIDGVDYEVIPIPQEVLRVTEGRIMGVTVEPFPAFQEAFIENDSGQPALTASGHKRLRMFCRMRRDMVTGVMLQPRLLPTERRLVVASADRFQFPAIPPREWFEVGEPEGPVPLTILDSGQVYGHVAVWGECHVGIAGECVEPPPSPSGYARFHLGEIPVEPSGRVAVGHLTFGNGHADTRLNAAAARAHYDDTCTVAADIRCHDGSYGIWCCGAARPGLTVEQIREVMSAPPSGDWRRFGNELDMVAALCVNVPGFNQPRAVVRKELGLVASLIVTHPAPPLRAAARLDAHTAASLREHLARSIGRSRSQRIAALRARIHPGGQ